MYVTCFLSDTDKSIITLFVQYMVKEYAVLPPNKWCHFSQGDLQAVSHVQNAHR